MKNYVDVMETFEVFEAIGKTTSRTAKETLLKQYWENYSLQVLLERTYNPFRVYGIKKVPAFHPTGKTTTDNGDSSYSKFLALLDKLETRQLTGNAAVNALHGFLISCDTDLERKWYGMVVKRDLKIGITDKTINKVSKGHIPVFTCMLAHPFKQEKLPKSMIVDPKLDGYRCLATVEELAEGAVSVTLRSRNGKELTGYTAIEEDLKCLPAGYIYDGEIMSEGTFADTQKTAFKKTDNKSGAFYIFDMVPIKEFVTEEFLLAYAVRRRMLSDAMFGNATLTNVKDVPYVHYTYADDLHATVMREHAKYLAEGFEGTMVKDADGVYAKKRTWAVQKVKDMETLDLTVVGVTEGLAGTVFEGKLGALVVEYKGNTVNVGSGYTVSQREELWATKEDLINRTIEVQYFEESTDSKTGQKSLRFPVFKGFRLDK